MALVKPRIMLVDDDTQILQSTSRGLMRAGYTITTSDNPASAFRLFDAGERFDVIVSDLEMPGMDGDDFCTRVQRIAPTPFILCSGRADVLVRAAACGAAGAFLKPVRITDLQAAIEGLIQSG